ncbi:hypothetical protein ACMD2_05746 [Ananas comosus]|uniref:Uncharacterized protein n=1 Tax=Ananas comosus TaxID=4615 RepID=A0A199VYZ3_ANACO|nr:hypothetical protein ACMD2_05746 [Ananas comosus]
MARRSRVYVLILLVLAVTLSIVYSASVQDTAVPEIYEIDYQGPETHSLPPPGLPYRGPNLANWRKRDAGRDRNPVHG